MDFNNLSKPGISTNLLQLLSHRSSIFERFDRFGILSNAMQSDARSSFNFGGKSGIDWSFLQLSKMRVRSFERPPRLDGRLWKWLFSRSKNSREHKLPRSLGIALSNKLQSLRLKSLSEFKPCTAAGNRLTDFGLFLGDIQDQRSEGSDLDDNPLHPHNDKYVRFFNCTMVRGTCLIAVLSARKVVTDSISPNSLAKLSNLEQPEIMRVWRDFNL
jgi:hypothetical protein